LYGLGILALLTACSGCFILLPSDFLSSLVLHPETSCSQLAISLNLGPLPDVATPADANLQYQPFTVSSANGQPIAGWFMPAQWNGQLDAEPVGTVLVLHGTDGAVPCALPWALVASANHMHAVVFDYQGYGASGGQPNMATLLDDGEAVFNWIAADAAPARQRIHLVGISLGTGPALGLADLRAKPQIQSVALDGAYDPEAMVSEVESTVCTLFPLFGASARLDFTWLFETRARLPEMTIPLMVIAAENDGTTPAAGAQKVFDLAGSSAKTFWLFQGLTHVQALFKAEQPYVSLLVTFWRNPNDRPSETAAAADATIRVPSFSL
jgi:hypothetical protein